MRFFTLFTLVFIASPALAWDFTVLGGLNYASPTQVIAGAKQDWTGSGAWSYGFFVADSILMSPFSWETGVLFEASKYAQNGGTPQTLKDTEVPLLLQFHFDENVQAGAGYYLSWSRETPPNALTSIDSGLVINLRARLHLVPLLNLIADARYEHGLKNRAANAADTYNTRSVQAFGGLELSL